MAQSYLGVKEKMKMKDYKPSSIKVFGPKERLAWAAAQKEPVIDITETSDSTAEQNLPGYTMKAKAI